MAGLGTGGEPQLRVAPPRYHAKEKRLIIHVYYPGMSGYNPPSLTYSSTGR